MAIREVSEGRQAQGADEEIVYSVTTTNWASSPTNVAVVVKDDSDASDVTSSVTTGSSSVSGDVITLPTIKSLASLYFFSTRLNAL